VLRSNGYSNPAVPGSSPGGISANQRLYDPTRPSSQRFIEPRDPNTGAGGLHKPSLRIPQVGGSPVRPNYLINSAARLASNPALLAPSNENDYVRDRDAASQLGKALFWDMQVGSDGVQSCGSCHAHAGADNRTRNQINPNDIGLPVGDNNFEVGQPHKVPGLMGANHDLVVGDFPFHELAVPDIAGDPKCTPAINATVNAGILENIPLMATVNPTRSATRATSAARPTTSPPPWASTSGASWTSRSPVPLPSAWRRWSGA
jgi:hypothetical protein